jgi:hypothetical protein
MVAELLLGGTLAAFGGIDINGAHTSHVRGGCVGDYGRTCAYVVPRWEPNARGRGGKLPFETSGRLTRIKLPLSGETTIRVRVVRAAGRDRFRVRASSPPLRIRREGWLTARLSLRYRKGDTIAIGVSGTQGPHTVYGSAEREPNGSGDLLLAADDGPTWIRRAYELSGDDGSELGYQGLSMIVTTAAARR